MPRRSWLQALGLSAFALAAVLAASAPAAATSYVMVADGGLADQAAVVAEGRIVSVAPSPAGGSPSTDYVLEIDRLIKGYTGGSSVVVRVLGGMPEDGGVGLKIWGAPSYREGERALLFLAPRPDGAYGVLHFLLGAFHEMAVGARPVVLRDLADADEVKAAPDGHLAAAPAADAPRDLARFARWIVDRENGSPRPPDYLVQLPAASLRDLRERFTLFTLQGSNLRWFVFDGGGSVTFFANQTGQQGLPGGGFAEYQRALAMWTGAGGTAIRTLYGGTTAATAGLKTFDNVNAVLFNDPNKEVDTAFSCSTGGVLAVSGPWEIASQTAQFKGRAYIPILGGDTVTNSGISCFFERSPCAGRQAEELFAHELGHILGLGHSCGDAESGKSCADPIKNDALMRANIHNDCRGARITVDEVDAIHALYSPPQKSPCRTTTNSLCLGGRYLATLRWYNPFDGSSGVGRAIPRTGSTGFFSFGDPSNVELLVKLLDFGDAVKVFYGELTNLQFTLTVANTTNGDVRTYSNTVGDCGAVDANAFESGASALAAREGASPGAGMAAARAAAGGACRADRNTLCLLSNRFAVKVDWANPGNGQSGAGMAAPLSKLVGTFYFTDPTNVELMVKLLQFPDRVAVFYGALSDLPYTIHVTDTKTGKVKTYTSTAGKLCGGLDNTAF